MTSITTATVFISGATSGIGEACAHAFAEHGSRLVLCARSPEGLERVKRELEERYDAQVYIVPLDVRNREAVFSAVASLPAPFSEISVLINNAGLAREMEKIVGGDPADWDEMIDTNVKGLLNVTRAILPGITLRGEGHVIMIGSTAGHITYQGGGVYCATKHAVGALARTLKKELHGTRVRVTSVDPGAVKTNFSIVRFKGDQERADAVYKDMEPLTPQDVAEAVLFCATRPSRVNINEIILTATDQTPLL